jgi:hypothetical protein
LPEDVAFEVFVRSNGKEYPAGAIYFRKGSESTFGVSTIDSPKDDPPMVDVILRSSEKVAEGTPDMTRIWKGEIVLKDVPLGGSAGPGPTTAPAASQK